MLRAMIRARSSAAAAVAIVALAWPAAGRADPPPLPPAEEGAVPGADPAPPPDGRRTLARLPGNLLRTVGGLVAVDNAVPFLVGAGVTGASFTVDDEVRGEMKGSDLGGLQSFGDTLGDAVVVAPLTAGLFLAGRASHDTRFRACTYDLAQAQLIATAVGGAAKRVIGRERPNGSNDRSFPSGHSYSWFTTATVVERHYGMRVAIPVFALWAVSAMSRVANDTHYISDSAGGAALGYLVARTTARVNAAPLPPGRPVVQVWPALGGHGRMAVVVTVTF